MLIYSQMCELGCKIERLEIGLRIEAGLRVVGEEISHSSGINNAGNFGIGECC